MEATARTEPEIKPSQRPDEKVKRDLEIVQEKINLATSMLEPLNSSDEVDSNEGLLSVIGFLEACLPRVRELVEAGMGGALQENTLIKCLAINDNLLQVLEYVEKPQLCVRNDAHAKGSSVTPPTDEFRNFGIGDDDDDFSDFIDASDSKLPAHSTSYMNTNTKASTLLDELLLTPDTQDKNLKISTGSSANHSLDDFDDFFGDEE